MGLYHARKNSLVMWFHCCEIWTWIHKYIQSFNWAVITHPGPWINSGLTESPLKLWHGYLTRATAITRTTILVHYYDVIMTTMASRLTSLMVVYSTVYSDADQSKHQSSASLAFVGGIHRGPVNSPHKWPVTRKMSPFDDVIMTLCCIQVSATHFNFGHP